MFIRKLIFMAALLGLVSACTTAKGTDAPTQGTDIPAISTEIPAAQSTDVFEVGIVPVTEINSSQAIKDELEPILRAMLGGTLTEQIAVIQYSRIACAAVDGLGGPPPCPEGVAEGTEVEVFPTLGPEGSFIAPENMETLLSNSILKNLYAVYRVTPNPNIEPYFPEGEYAMLFERDMNDISLPVVLRVADGKIVRMDFSFGVSAADQLKGIPVEDVIVSPQDAKAWTESMR